VAGALFATSFAVIYLQVTLLRYLDYVYFGTFTSLVVGLALIGFGAGGTFLALARKRITGRESVWFVRLALLGGFGVLLGYAALRTVRPDLAFLLYDAGEVGRFLLLILAWVPAFLGAGALIGLILIAGEGRRSILYGINLAAGGLGGLGGLAAAY
jgi:hypothetical protein